MTAHQYGFDRHPSHVAADALSSDLDAMRARLPGIAALADSGDDVAAALEETMRTSIAELETEIADLYADEHEWEDDE